MHENKTQKTYNNDNKLINERKKIETHCLNLEYKNEQLKILIEKLHKLSCHKENFLLNKPAIETFSKDVESLYLKNSPILEELKIAKEQRTTLESCISELKNRIFRINEILFNE